MFKKLVAIEPISLIPSAEKELHSLAEHVVLYNDMPSSVDDIVERIGDADAVLLSYTTTLDKEAIAQCPNITYIGMCCSLYTPESANVDINYANSRDITVTGIRDYGDEGVVEYVISALVSALHGFGNNPDGSSRTPWNGLPSEITGLKAGIIGLGKSGGMIADALRFFGADVSYYSRTRKPEAEAKCYHYLPLKALLQDNEVIITCLNKNTILLHDAEFEAFGNHKILFNTGLSPAWDAEPFNTWLDKDNRVYCDTLGALGDTSLLNHPHVNCVNISVGRTRQAFDRLSRKVLENIENHLKKQLVM